MIALRNILKIVLPVIAFLLFVNSWNNRSYGKDLKDPNIVWVDVREESEIKEGMLEKALWMPMSQFTASKKTEYIEKLKKQASQGKKVYVYCRSGGRAGRFQQELKSHGIETENLGGFSSLKDQLATIKGKTPECCGQ